jgi:hypothetical protein
MKIDRLKALSIAAATVFVGMGVIQPQAVQAKPIFLADLKCIVTKGNSWSPGAEDVILNREIYTSLMYATRSFNSFVDSEFACKLPSAKSAELDLEMGIPSKEGGPILITFYLNGNQVVSEKVFPGKIISIKEALTGRADAPYQVGGRKTLVVETTCMSGSGCGYIRFFKANLNVVGNPGAKE